MSVIFRLTNTKEAVFIKYNLECYLYYLFNASNKTFISFEEYLMVQMKEAMDQKLLKFNDVLKIIETYEKFVTSPILIKHVFEMDPYNIARSQKGKKSIYYDLIEDSYTYFSKALKCHLKNNSDKDSLIGVVLDTGGGMINAYKTGWILIDLAYESESKIEVGINKKTSFSVKRWGW